MNSKRKSSQEWSDDDVTNQFGRLNLCKNNCPKNNTNDEDDKSPFVQEPPVVVDGKSSVSPVVVDDDTKEPAVKGPTAMEWTPFKEKPYHLQPVKTHTYEEYKERYTELPKERPSTTMMEMDIVNCVAQLNLAGYKFDYNLPDMLDRKESKSRVIIATSEKKTAKEKAVLNEVLAVRAVYKRIGEVQQMARAELALVLEAKRRAVRLDSINARGALANDDKCEEVKVLNRIIAYAPKKKRAQRTRSPAGPSNKRAKKG